MDGDVIVGGGAQVDLRVGLLADGGHHDRQSLCPCCIQQQKGKAPVAGNETELHAAHRIEVKTVDGFIFNATIVRNSVVLCRFVQLFLRFLRAAQTLEHLRMEA